MDKNDLEKISENLERDGFFYIPNPISSFDFRDICGEFGEIISETEVCVKDKSSKRLHTNLPMGLHSDHPDVEIVAWHCHISDEEGGALLLLDISKMISEFSLNEIENLKKITVRVPPLGDHPERHQGLLSILDQRNIFYYADWLVQEPVSEYAQAALLKFERVISSSPEVKSIHLQRGEAILVDNRRMLHGRSGFSTNSQRFIKRLWLCKRKERYT